MRCLGRGLFVIFILFKVTKSQTYENTQCQFNFINLTEYEGVTTILLSDDDYFGPLLLNGFEMEFYGLHFSSLFIYSNGYLSFVNNTIMRRLSLCTDQPSLNYSILLMFDDMNPMNLDRIYFKEFLQCPLDLNKKCAIIAYNNFHHYAPPGSQGGSAGTWQVVIMEGGNIVLQYLDVGTEGGLFASAGISGVGSQYMLINCRELMSSETAFLLGNQLKG